MRRSVVFRAAGDPGSPAGWPVLLVDPRVPVRVATVIAQPQWVQVVTGLESKRLAAPHPTEALEDEVLAELVRQGVDVDLVGQ